MTARNVNVAILVIFLLTVPAGIFFWLTSPAWGYPKLEAAIVPIIVVVIGAALLPKVIRGELKIESQARPSSTSIRGIRF